MMLLVAVARTMVFPSFFPYFLPDLSRGRIFHAVFLVTDPGPIPLPIHDHVMPSAMEPRGQMGDPDPPGTFLVEINMGFVIVVDPPGGIVPIVIDQRAGAWARSDHDLGPAEAAGGCQQGQEDQRS
jgi:hypothetical protein